MIGSLTARIFAIFWLTLALVLMLVLMLPKLDSRQMTELLDSEQRQGLMIEQHVEAELANDPPNDLMWWRRLFQGVRIAVQRPRPRREVNCQRLAHLLGFERRVIQHFTPQLIGFDGLANQRVFLLIT